MSAPAAPFPPSAITATPLSIAALATAGVTPAARSWDRIATSNSGTDW